VIRLEDFRLLQKIFKAKLDKNRKIGGTELTLNLLTTTVVAPPSNAGKWQIGFNSPFKGLRWFYDVQTDKKLYVLRGRCTNS
jgi:hypothetical protein